MKSPHATVLPMHTGFAFQLLQFYKVFAMKRNRGLPVLLVLVVLAFAARPARACTIFVLTDATRALFCNNEDWSNPKTRVWFLPAGKGTYGAAYVGFDDGMPAGGLNTEGLAYDWVMMSKVAQKWDMGLPRVRGAASQRMLETCATVREAVAFFRSHADPTFATCRILVADKTGASVIMGMKDGRLELEESSQSRGFGFGGRGKLGTALARRAAAPNPPQPTVREGFEILHDCRQAGEYPTQYANVFDLKSGEIFLRPLSEPAQEVSLELTAELAKGGHYYEIPRLRQQVAEAPRALPPRLARFPLDGYQPIADKEPNLTAHVRTMVRDEAQGTPRAEDFAADFWKAEVLPNVKRGQAELKRLGEIVALSLVDREDTNGLRGFRYRLDMANARVLLHVVLDAQGKVTVFSVEDVEWRAASQ
jgi:hypothetical protein